MNQRKTRQKQAIIEILCSTKCHPTADWVYDEARKTIPNISKGTVYRNLKLLSQSGRIIELKIDSNANRYDGNPSSHYHLKCENCGCVIDLDVPVKQDLDRWIEETTGARVNFHQVEFFGVCQECAASWQTRAN